MEHEYKQVEFKLTNLDTEGRTIEGYAAVFGNRDLGGDVIHPGAFSKTLAERGNRVRFLWQHNPGEPLGKVVEMREDPVGLFIKAMVSDTARGRDALALLRDGAINGMSIGYDAIPGGTDYTKETTGETTRNLREVKLYEFSLATFPMNERAGVTALKMVTPYGNLPLADRMRAWDSGAADARVRTWAEATDAANPRYARAFFWHDAEAPELFGSYKLGFADVIDGELTAIPRGIFAVAAVLQGSRGGVDIPEADKAAVQRVVERYYEKMRREFDDESIVVPWRKSSLFACDDCYKEQGLDEVYASPFHSDHCDFCGRKVFSPNHIPTKSGRMLSTASIARIQSAIDAAQTAIGTLEDLVNAATGAADEEEMPTEGEEEMACKPKKNIAPADEAGRVSNEAGPVSPPTSETERKRKLLEIALLQIQLGG